MVIGTFGSFFVMILANQNRVAENKKLQETYAKYQKQTEEYQRKIKAQAGELSKKYYPKFKAYAKYPESFKRDSVKKLRTEDLEIGSGKTITKDSKFSVYYIGWNPDGKVFDQSIDKGSLKLPIVFDKNLITGWKEGVKGMKIGGVRLIEIPSDKAYGEKGAGKDIPPNTPIKFIVMPVDSPNKIDPPKYNMEGLAG